MRSGRRCSWGSRGAVAAFLILFGASAPAMGKVLLGDFENGVGEWTSNDGVRSYANDVEHARVRFFPSRDTPAEGGEYSLYVMFLRAQDTWASFSVPVDGAELAREGATRLELDLKGDGSPDPIRVVFRSSRRPGDDRSFETMVSLKDRNWKHISIPLEDFVAGDQTLPEEGLEHVWLFQFVRTGSWDDTYFRIDNLEIIGSAEEAAEAPIPPEATVPEAAPAPTTEGPPTPTPPPPPPALSFTVRVDFSRKLMDFRSTVGANVLPDDVEALSDPALRTRVQELNMPILRTVFRIPSEFGDSESIGALDRTIAAIRSLGGSALVCLDVPLGPQTSESWLTHWAAILVKHFNKDTDMAVSYWEIFDEPLFAPSDLGPAIRLFESAAVKMRSVDPKVRVGGFGLSFADENQLWALMNGAHDSLSFCSWHFYGGHTLSASDDALMEAANAGIPFDTPNPIGPRRADELLRAAGLSRGLLFVTECNSNASQSDGKPLDSRLAESFNASWLVSYAMAAGPFVDVIFIWRLLGDGWGMLDAQGHPGPLYWAAWLLNQYAPRGASVFASEHSAPGIRAMAVGTQNSRAVFLVNQMDQPASIEVLADGLKPSKPAEVHRLDASGQALVDEEPIPPPPPSPESARAGSANALGRIDLDPYGVAVLVVPSQ